MDIGLTAVELAKARNPAITVWTLVFLLEDGDLFVVESIGQSQVFQSLWQGKKTKEGKEL